MLKWWKGLSQNNQVALIVPFLIAVLAAAGYFGKGWIEQPNPPPVAVIVVYHSELLIVTFLLFFLKKKLYRCH